MGRQFGPGRSQRLAHFAKDVGTAFLRLGKRGFKDFARDARNLDVHLHRGDAFGRTGHLEVHVAQMIFITQNVGQDGKILAFQDQAHGDAGHRALQWHACVHHRQRTAADSRHRGRTIGFGNVGQDADRVGEFVLAGQHGVQRTPGQLAMTHFTTTRRAEAADFTDRIGREVIVQHEIFIMQAGQAVDHLLGVLGAQRGGADGLRFTAGEQGRTMGAGQEADHCFDRTDLRGRAAVDALAVLQDGAAHDFRFQLLGQLDAGHYGLGVETIGNERRLRLGAGFVQRVGTRRLVGQLVGGGDVLADQLLQLLLQVIEIVALRHVPRILGRLFSQADDGVHNLLARVMREQDGAQHDFFRKLLGFGFDHHHSVVGRGDDQVEFTGLCLVQRRVELIFAILVTDAGRADRSHEGHAGQGQRSRRGDHRHNVRLAFAVERQHLGDNVDFVIETFGEQRTDRAVDQAGNQRFLFGRAALTLEKAAGNAAGGGIFFLIVNGQGEEILAFLHALGGGHGAQHHGFAIGRQHGGVSLAGDAAGFEGQRLAGQLDRYFLDIKHSFFLRPHRPYCRAGPLAEPVRLHG